ncbi:MAG: Serine/threonine-protein kinase PknD [Phycisphaerae bacterium]|nr:Serine/threonine-protein kinase PknD [Phycisphaerae bacterium]
MSDEVGSAEAARAARIQSMIDECIRREAAGERVDSAEVIAAHADLLPELAARLRELSLVRAAIGEVDAPAARDALAAGKAAVLPSAMQPGEPPRMETIPGYEISGEIHRGGQGVVYQAIQKTTRRKVAIKVMREGPFASPGERARFEREVQVLAALKHPNIVAIHESGVYAGTHYFVMDYISGMALDAWIAEQSSRGSRGGAGRRGAVRGSGEVAPAAEAGAPAGARDSEAGKPAKGAGALAIDETLRLFARICDAVNAAHVRGIIHRDLKPTNIRVDADGRPHILDFGLAKVAGADAGGGAMTMTGQFVGSLPWASPEQAEGAPDRVDMRTDVYSLGVILYQMLTRRFPYEVAGQLRDVLDNIMRAAPARPSTIRRQINDEVETIILKCLAKERERRYQTAGELGRDIERYLAGQPIEAKRDSFGYVLRKQIRRYKLPAAVASAFALSILGGLIASLTFWRQATAQRDAAELARSGEASERRRAEGEAQRARLEQAKAEAVSSFLQELLGSIDPEQSRGREVTVREVLDKAGRELRQITQPAVEATARRILGTAYQGMGRLEQAKMHLQASVKLQRGNSAEPTQELITTLSELATTEQESSNYAEAERLFLEVLDLQRGLSGADDPRIATELTNLGVLQQTTGKLDAAEQYYRDALTILERNPADRRAMTTRANLATLVCQRGRVDEALEIARELLETGEGQFETNHPKQLQLLMNLGLVLKTAGRLDEAERLYRRSMAGLEAVLGPGHAQTLGAAHNLARLLQDRGQLAPAEELLRQSLERAQSSLDAGNMVRLQVENSLARLLQETHREDEAETLLVNVAETARRVDPNHSLLPIVLHNLGVLKMHRGALDDSERMLREAVELLGRQVPGHWMVANAQTALGRTLLKRERHAEAEQMLLAAFEALSADARAPAQARRQPIVCLVDLYRATGRSDEAARWQEKLGAPASQATSRP